MLRLRRMFLFGEAWRNWRRGEAGMSEAAVAIFVLPFLMALIFTLIEVGFNLRFRAGVDGITQDTVRGVAQDGANYWDRTSTLPLQYQSSDLGWSAWGTDRLNELCETTGRCEPQATMTCTPALPASAPGALVQCTAVVPYEPVVEFTSNGIFSLGFSGLWADGIEQTVESRTVVGTGE